MSQRPHSGEIVKAYDDGCCAEEYDGRREAEHRAQHHWAAGQRWFRGVHEQISEPERRERGESDDQGSRCAGGDRSATTSTCQRPAQHPPLRPCTDGRTQREADSAESVRRHERCTS